MIIGIIGGIGTGKTMLMSQLLFLEMISGVNVLANYKLNFPYKNLLAISDLNEIKETKNVLGIDEPYTSGLDSRESQSNQNKLMSKNILQSRKKRMDVFITSQFLSAIEKRARGLIDFVYYPDIIAYDKLGRPSFLNVNVHRMRSYDEVYKLPYSSFVMPMNIGKVYAGDLYDTFEIVEGLENQEIHMIREKIKFYMNKADELSKKDLTDYIWSNERLSFDHTISKSLAGQIANTCKLRADGKI